MLFDTHAHYDDERFDKDRDELLVSMPGNNVGLILNPGCELESSKKAVEYARKYHFMYAAVGIHPENIDENWEKDLEEIRALAESEPKVRAIGEIGLDYYWEKDEHKRARQNVVFRKQMELAGTLKLPVVIHDREAHRDSLEMVQNFPDIRGVFHCYSGSAEMAKELLKLGYYISFTGVVTFQNAKKILGVVKEMPLDRIMIETDSPYLTPSPFRKRRNSSLYVYRVAETIAEIKNMEVSEIERITTENGKRFFGIA